jgi:phage N-6-adenine-methyltransferase
MPPRGGRDVDEWATPQGFFDLLDREFHFTLDQCATPENAKCPVYLTKERDGLTHAWSGTAFVNPPYGPHGSTIGDWVRTAYESRFGCTSVLLLPVRADTAWWGFCTAAAEIRFMRNRLYFSLDGKTLRAPFATCLWVFNGRNQETRISVMPELPKAIRGR